MSTPEEVSLSSSSISRPHVGHVVAHAVDAALRRRLNLNQEGTFILRTYPGAAQKTLRLPPYEDTQQST